MDWFSIVLGILALAYGVYTLNARKKNDYTSFRLDNMKNLFGDEKGDKIHLVVYGIVPIFLGILMLLKAYGISL